MPHQDTVLLIYVFSIFGLVLLLMFSSFYACHLYAQRLERLNPPNPAPPAQDAEGRLVPMKQAFFIEQPDGKSDVAWAISTVVDAQPLIDSAPGNVAKPAALTQAPNGDLSALQSSSQAHRLPGLTSSRTQLLPGSAGSFHLCRAEA
ncbi:hypothetical protein WJX77_004918 [Trebouxia sp. C0004]